jgi:CheY-like chemotaxis protein
MMSAPISVYLVDPFADESEMYAEYLRFEGFKVRILRDADRACSEAALAQPSVVVARIRQENSAIDGIALTRSLKDSPSTAHIPVVVITTSISPDDRRAAEDAGCDGFCLLPVSPETIASEIRRVVSSQRA